MEKILGLTLLDKSREKNLVNRRPTVLRHVGEAMNYLNRVTSALVRLVLLIIVVLIPHSGTAAPEKYVVKKNDTLIAIARRHGISLSLLIRHNHLARPDRIFPGDILRIPDSLSNGNRLDAALRRKLECIRVERNRWKYIVIHHSATDSGTLKGMDRYHRDERHMENGLAYHFLIGNGHGMDDGDIAIGQRWTDQLHGGHLASESLNQNSIGICLVGNFDVRRPTEQQLTSLRNLVDYLVERCALPTSALRTHQQINPIHTRCPGSKFPKSFLSELAKR